MSEAVRPKDIATPHLEYRAILDRDPRLQTWYRFHSETLPKKLKEGEGDKISNILLAYLKESHGLAPSLRLPPIRWVANEPVARNITGGNFALPIMEFKEHQLELLEQIAGNRFGAEGPVPIELMSRGDLTHQDSIESRILFVADASVATAMPYIERRQHEITHGIDPYAHSRTGDPLVMNELVAITGSYADDEAKTVQLRLAPGYITPYIAEQAQRTKTSLTTEELAKQAALVEHIVNRSTFQFEGGVKIPNDRVTRKIMACRSLDELKQNWPELFKFNLIKIISTQGLK